MAFVVNTLPDYVEQRKGELIAKVMLGFETKKYINDMLLIRFERDNCPDVGEDEHNVFAKQISNFVNGKCHDMEKTARLMANDHRYLVQEMFKLFIAFAKELSKDFFKGAYDPRNQWACSKSVEIMNKLGMM